MKSWSEYVQQVNELAYAENCGADDETLRELYEQSTLSDPRTYVYLVTRWHKDLGLHEFVSVHPTVADAELARTRYVESFGTNDVTIPFVPIGTVPEEAYKQIIK